MERPEPDGTRNLSLPPPLRIREATTRGFTTIYDGECFDAEHPTSKTRRGRKMAEKSNNLMAQQNTSFMRYKNARIRRLTPKECARLQTIPSWYEFIEQDLKDNETCKNVKLMDVANQLSLNNMAIATNTICGIFAGEQQKQEGNLLITLKNAPWMDATENNKQQWDYVLNTIKLGNEVNLKTKQKSALYVVNQLEFREPTECAAFITITGENMETLYIPKRENSFLMEILGSNTTNLEESSFIELLQKKYSEGLCEKERLFITSILTNWIIAKRICSSVQTKNTLLFIDSLNVLQHHYLKMESLSLKMGVTKRASDSSIYKLLGNGWTVDAVKEFFKFLPESWRNAEPLPSYDPKEK